MIKLIEKNIKGIKAFVIPKEQVEKLKAASRASHERRVLRNKGARGVRFGTQY